MNLRNLKKATLIFGLLILTTAAFSQGIEGGDLVKSKSVLLKKPMAYDNPNGKKIEGPDAKRSEKDREANWRVFSDRDNNPTYFDKNCTKKNVTLHFMECFVVAQETEDAVRIVRFDPVNQPFIDKPGSKKGELIFKPSAEDVGWIKKKYLLLWDRALVNDSTKYTKKAISVKKLDNSSGNGLQSIIKKGILDLYTYPEADKSKYSAGKDITLFQYLFILKEDPESKMLLVAKANRITPSGSSDEMLGWAKKSELQVWDNAVCLRINFDEEAIQERKEKNIKVQFFKDINGAKTFRDGKVAPALPFVYDDPNKDGENRDDNPYFYGFPIIDKDLKEPNIYKTGYVTQTVNSQGKDIFSASRQAKINETFEGIKKNFTKVNILFVIDGSQRQFMKTVSQAIRDIALLDGSSNTTKNEYKIGGIIYNDAKCEEDAFKTIALMKDKDSFIEKLTDEANKTSPCVVNRDLNGAPIYTAVTKACNMFDSKDQTNIIVVVGTTSDPIKTGKAEALKSLIEKQVKINFFQTVSKDGALYDAFVKDCQGFLIQNAQAFDKKYFPEDLKSGKLKPATIKSSETDNFAFLENSGVPGNFQWVDAGGQIKPSDVSKKIQKLIRENENRMNQIIERYDGNTTGAAKGVKEGADDQEETKQLMALFLDKGFKAEDIDQLANVQNFQLFIEGYASVSNKNLAQPVLTRTLFISRTEYQDLVDIFANLNDSYTSSNQRTGAVNTYKEIIKKYKGSSGKDDLLDFNLNDFMKLVTGLSGISTNPLFKRSLEDIQNEKKTSAEELAKLKNSFALINSRLKKVKGNKNLRLEQGDESYYWIPESVFHIDF